jgi:hypothetical protein
MWSTRGMTARCSGHSMTATRPPPRCRRIGWMRSATSPNRRGWCNRGRRGRDHLDARAAPQPSAGTPGSWCWPPPDRPSTLRCAKASPSRATPSPRPYSYSTTTSCACGRTRWWWWTRPAWSAPTTCAACSRRPPPPASRPSWSATPISWRRSRRAAACSNNSAPICPGPNTFPRCGARTTRASAPPRWRYATATPRRCAARCAGISARTGLRCGGPDLHGHRRAGGLPGRHRRR